MNNNNFRYPAI